MAELERQYPNWRGRFTSLAAAVEHHTTAQDLVIKNLRKQNVELRTDTLMLITDKKDLLATIARMKNELSWEEHMALVAKVERLKAENAELARSSYLNGELYNKEYLQRESAEKEAKDRIADLEQAWQDARNVAEKVRIGYREGVITGRESMREEAIEAARMGVSSSRGNIINAIISRITDIPTREPDCSTCAHYHAPCTQNQFNPDCKGYVPTKEPK